MTRNDANLSGEDRLKRRRARLARFGVLGFVAGVIGGFATGALGRMAASGDIPTAVLAILWAAIMATAIWFTRDYFRQIDELDLLDNLWASTIALYAFLIAAGSWYVFHDIGLAPPPSFELLALFTFAILLVAYGLRKLGWRSF